MHVWMFVRVDVCRSSIRTIGSLVPGCTGCSRNIKGCKRNISNFATTIIKDSYLRKLIGSSLINKLTQFYFLTLRVRSKKRGHDFIWNSNQILVRRNTFLFYYPAKMYYLSRMPYAHPELLENPWNLKKPYVWNGVTIKKAEKRCTYFGKKRKERKGNRKSEYILHIHTYRELGTCENPRELFLEKVHIKNASKVSCDIKMSWFSKFWKIESRFPKTMLVEYYTIKNWNF